MHNARKLILFKYCKSKLVEPLQNSLKFKETANIPGNPCRRALEYITTYFLEFQGRCYIASNKALAREFWEILAQNIKD